MKRIKIGQVLGGTENSVNFNTMHYHEGRIDTLDRIDELRVKVCKT